MSSALSVDEQRTRVERASRQAAAIGDHVIASWTNGSNYFHSGSGERFAVIGEVRPKPWPPYTHVVFEQAGVGLVTATEGEVAHVGVVLYETDASKAGNGNARWLDSHRTHRFVLCVRVDAAQVGEAVERMRAIVAHLIRLRCGGWQARSRRLHTAVHLRSPLHEHVRRGDGQTLPERVRSLRALARVEQRLDALPTDPRQMGRTAATLARAAERQARIAAEENARALVTIRALAAATEDVAEALGEQTVLDGVLAVGPELSAAETLAVIEAVRAPRGRGTTRERIVEQARLAERARLLDA